MNPSSYDWIDKFGYPVKDKNDYFGSFEDLYALLKAQASFMGSICTFLLLLKKRFLCQRMKKGTRLPFIQIRGEGS
jgi:hypothetical protein